MHDKYAYNMKINEKRKYIKVLLALEVKNPWRNLRENDKNLALNLRPIEERERKAFEKFESDTTHEKLMVFKELYMQFSIGRKIDLINQKYLRLIQQRSK